MRIILLPGTHSAYGENDRDEWWFTGKNAGGFQYAHASPFVHYIRQAALEPWPFLWESRINGGPSVLLPWNWFGKRRHTTWESWGDALAERLLSVPPRERIVLAHSHGGAVATKAFSQVHGRLLITVATPVRDDCKDWYGATSRNVERWVHVHSDADRMFRWGSYFDGKFDLFAKDKSQPYAHENIFIPGVGHSGLLRSPEHFHWWQDSGLIGMLQDACLVSKDCEGVL